jgi:hypothetical protein
MCTILEARGVFEMKRKQKIDPVYDSAQRISYVTMNNAEVIKQLLRDGKTVLAYEELNKLQKYAYEQYTLIMEEKK